MRQDLRGGGIRVQVGANLVLRRLFDYSRYSSLGRGSARREKFGVWLPEGLSGRRGRQRTGQAGRGAGRPRSCVACDKLRVRIWGQVRGK